MNNGNDRRVCRWCGKEKVMSAFPLVRGKHFRKCKSCTYALSHKWSCSNRERSNKTKREWNERNLLYKSEWAEKNKERRLQNYRKKYADNPQAFRENARKREARNKLVGGRFTKKDLAELLIKQKGRCANPYCRDWLDTVGFHIDHIIPVVHGGCHSLPNRQLLCPACNRRKHDKSNNQFLDLENMRTYCAPFWDLHAVCGDERP